MTESTNDIFIKLVIDRMWSVLGEQEFHGLTPYEVARKLGLNHDGAKKVDELWDGPKIF
jgi:hypothetical protein